MEEESLGLLAEPLFMDLYPFLAFPSAHTLDVCGAVVEREIVDAGQFVGGCGWFSESIVGATPYNFKWVSSDLISAASR